MLKLTQVGQTVAEWNTAGHISVAVVVFDGAKVITAPLFQFDPVAEGFSEFDLDVMTPEEIVASYRASHQIH